MLKHILHSLTLNLLVSIGIIALGHVLSYLFG